MQSFNLTDSEKTEFFKLVKRQVKNAKTYNDSPALEYLFECRELLRFFIYAKEREKEFTCDKNKGDKE